MISDDRIEEIRDGDAPSKSERQEIIDRLRAAEKESADLKHFIAMKLVVEPLDKAGVWMKPEEFDRNAIIERCAEVCRNKWKNGPGESSYHEGWNDAVDIVEQAILALKDTP